MQSEAAVAHLSVVRTSRTERDVAPDTSHGYDDDLRLVPVRLLLAVEGRCSCDDCCRAFLAGDRDAGVIEVPLPRLRLVGS